MMLCWISDLLSGLEAIQDQHIYFEDNGSQLAFGIAEGSLRYLNV